MDSQKQNQLHEDEITLGVLLQVLWRGKWLIFFVTVLFALAAGVAIWLTPNSYKASVLLSPVSNSSGGQLGGLGSVASQFGGLASLAGISAPGDSRKSESLAILQSEALTEKYIRENDLLPVLYERKWDAEQKRWKETDPKEIPTLWKANEYFKKEIRTVTTEAKTGLVTLTITWRDPQRAAKWANDLVALTNDYVRGKAIGESERNIAFLNDEAVKTTVVEAKQAIYKILENEINKVMLARGNSEYALKILDPAVPPEKASSPQKFIWILGGFFGGLFLGACAALLRSSPRK
jgi:uncharacterized protein involved in exopolysaccharide biosynthesis